MLIQSDFSSFCTIILKGCFFMFQFLSSLNDYLSSCTIPNISFFILFFGFIFMGFVIFHFCHKWAKSYDKLLSMYNDFFDALKESVSSVEVIDKSSSDE